MTSFRKSLALAGVIVVGGLAFGAQPARAQFGLGIATPGFGLGIGSGVGYGGGYYPAYAAPVIVPAPIVVAPPFYGPRPYFGGGYYGGPRGYYGGPHGYHGGHPGYGHHRR